MEIATSTLRSSRVADRTAASLARMEALVAATRALTG